MHSPSRKVTAKEQAEWKIPPCISNWKNPRGYTIPLDKRVAADGRGLQQVHINENFAKLAEALYTADRKAREAVTLRDQIERKVASKERERKEEQLQKIAMEARAERAGIRRAGGDVDDADLADRDQLRRERARDRAHDRNLGRAGTEGKVRDQRDRERDISEQIALGMPNPRANANTESMFDQRLFNQSRGMDSGFAGGKPIFLLFNATPQLKGKMISTISTTSHGELRQTLAPTFIVLARRIQIPLICKRLGGSVNSYQREDSLASIKVTTSMDQCSSNAVATRIPSTSVISCLKPRRLINARVMPPFRLTVILPTVNVNDGIKAHAPLCNCFDVSSVHSLLFPGKVFYFNPPNDRLLCSCFANNVDLGPSCL